MKKENKNSPYKIVARNKRATFEYFLETEYEAGLCLLGTEIKSLREGKANIQDAFVEFSKSGELFLINSHISPYKMATVFNHEPLRKRKLLLHSKEIKKIIGKIKLKGFTVIPTVLYINDRNLAKIKIAVAKGKKLYDKRESIKERDQKRNEQRLLKYSDY